MTWANRLKLGLGLLLVVALAAVFTVIFTQRQSEVTSTSATIAADTYAVGTDYGGTVIVQNVNVGDPVAAGDVLFVVQSLSLLQDLQQNLVTFDTASYSVQPDGTMTFKATVPGIIADIDTKLGDFVQAGAELATINRADSLYVVGDYTLTPRDYERIEEGAPVDLILPNQTTLEGKVEEIAVRTADGQAQAEIKIASDYLVQGAYSGLVTPGTPVDAALHLRQDGVFAGVLDASADFLQQIGL
jgi:multidrug resistance efflux pump